MVTKEEECYSDDELGEFDEGDMAVIEQGETSTNSPLLRRSRQQNPNVCRVASHSTHTAPHGQSRSILCMPTPQPTTLPPPPPAS
jgi:hypothetical protein